MLLDSQKNDVAMLNYYDGGIGPSTYMGMFNPDTFYLYKTYYAFKSFNEAYKLGFEALSESSNDDVFVLAAKNDENGVILIANTSDTSLTLDIETIGADINQGNVIMTDDEYLYTFVGNVIKNNKLTIKEYSCIEIRMELKQ